MVRAQAMGVERRLERLSVCVDDWTRQFLGTVGITTDPLRHMIAYHLGWAGTDLRPLAESVGAGKRLRPGVCLLVAETVSGDFRCSAAPAVAIELVHNFSLVHDDIQDASDVRRHRPTVWALWGAPQAINVGDGLFALSQLALIHEFDSPAPPEVTVQAIVRLNRTCLALVEGQFLDLELQQAHEVTLAEYQRMVAGKTAALFQCACELGALYAGASGQAVEAYGRFGHQLGLAFQYQDDLFGVWGEAQVTGKAATDLRSKKKGLPVALALERLDGTGARRLRNLFLSSGELSNGQVEELQTILERGGVRAEAEAMVEREYRDALRYLDKAASASALPSGQLGELCDLLQARRA